MKRIPATYNVPFDEAQVLDAIFGPSDDVRWSTCISYKDMMLFELGENSGTKKKKKKEKILIDSFEKIEF